MFYVCQNHGNEKHREHDPEVFRGRMGSIFMGFKEGNIHDSAWKFQLSFLSWYEFMKWKQFLWQIMSLLCHTKHVCIRYMDVNKYIEGGIAKIVFIKCDENNSEIVMKNLSWELHKKHSNKMIGKKSDWLPRFKKIKDKRKGVRYDVSSSYL